MKLLSPLLWISLATIAAGAPKFAVVRVTEIYRSLPSASAVQKDIQAQRDAILRNKRSESLRAIIAEKPLDESGETPEAAEVQSEPTA